MVTASTIRPVIVGSFSPPILACIRSWGRIGCKVGFLNISETSNDRPSSRHLTAVGFLPQKDLFTENGAASMAEFLESFGATGVLSIDEKISIWLNDIKRLLPPTCDVWLASNHTIRRVLSKKEQAMVAEKAGLPVLPTYYVDQHDESIEAVSDGHFPLCIRPSIPGTVKPGFKVRLVHAHDELRRVVNGLKTFDTPLIGQPFIDLPNLVVHGCRTVSGETIGIDAFLVYGKFEGVTLLIKRIAVSPGLIDRCIRFTELFDLTGNYHFEFLYDPDTRKVFFLEINHRFGGTTAKVLVCGYDEPLLTLKAFGVPVDSGGCRKTDVSVSSKLALVKYILYLLAGKLTPFDYPNKESVSVRLIKALWALATCKDEVINRKDIRGSLSFYKHNLLSKFPRPSRFVCGRGQ